MVCVTPQNSAIPRNIPHYHETFRIAPQYSAMIRIAPRSDSQERGGEDPYDEREESGNR